VSAGWAVSVRHYPPGEPAGHDQADCSPARCGIPEPGTELHELVWIDRTARPAIWTTRCGADAPLHQAITPNPYGYYQVDCPGCIAVAAASAAAGHPSIPVGDLAGPAILDAVAAARDAGRITWLTDGAGPVAAIVPRRVVDHSDRLAAALADIASWQRLHDHPMPAEPGPAAMRGAGCRPECPGWVPFPGGQPERPPARWETP